MIKGSRILTVGKMSYIYEKGEILVVLEWKY